MAEPVKKYYIHRQFRRYHGEECRKPETHEISEEQARNPEMIEHSPDTRHVEIVEQWEIFLTTPDGAEKKFTTKEEVIYRN